MTEAEPLLKRALAILEKALPEGHPDIAHGLNNLAFLYEAKGGLTEAELLYKRALAMNEKTLPADHPIIAIGLGNLSSALARQHRLREAWPYARRATAALVKRDAAEAAAVSTGGPERGHNENAFFTGFFRYHMQVASHIAELEPSQVAVLRNEAFLMAQRAARTEAANALAQTSARFGAGDTAIAKLVRERQDLAGRWQASDKALNAALTKPMAQRAGADELCAPDYDATIDSRIADIDRRLKADFPNYFALASPEPLSIEVAANLLTDDEALVVLVAGHTEETYVFAVTRHGAAWHRIPLGRKALGATVAELRKGLDINAVEASIKASKPALFSLGLAHALYVKLIGPIEPLIRAKRHLLVVSSGALSSLPLSVLVTAPPAIVAPQVVDPARYRDAAWLIVRHAVTTLPSVASLKALRRTSGVSAATKPLVGYGDPQFDRGRGPVQGPARSRLPQPVAMPATGRVAVQTWTRSPMDLRHYRRRSASYVPLPRRLVRTGRLFISAPMQRKPP